MCISLFLLLHKFLYLPVNVTLLCHECSKFLLFGFCFLGTLGFYNQDFGVFLSRYCCKNYALEIILFCIILFKEQAPWDEQYSTILLQPFLKTFFKMSQIHGRDGWGKVSRDARQESVHVPCSKFHWSFWNYKIKEWYFPFSLNVEGE